MAKIMVLIMLMLAVILVVGMAVHVVDGISKAHSVKECKLHKWGMEWRGRFLAEDCKDEFLLKNSRLRCRVCKMYPNEDSQSGLGEYE